MAQIKHDRIHYLFKHIVLYSLLYSLILLLFNVFVADVHAKKMNNEIAYQNDEQLSNQIPYLDNRFRIDENLDEITLLFYRPQGSYPIILVRPDGTKLKFNEIKGKDIQWADGKSYDMIKIKSPMVGPWQVIGQVLPNSKIMIMSDLTLKASPLPKNILQGEVIKIKGELYNGDALIDNPAFNDIVKLNIEFVSTKNEAFANVSSPTVKLTTLEDNGRGLDEHANDSIFTGELIFDFTQGEWLPFYKIDLPMFARELALEPIIIRPNPVKTSFELTQNSDQQHIVTFKLDDSYIDVKTILLQGKIKLPNRKVEKFSITEGKDNIRQYKLDYTSPGVHRIAVDVFGETIDGREFFAQIPEQKFTVLKALEVPKNEDGLMNAEKKHQQRVAKLEALAKQRVKELEEAKRQQEQTISEQQESTLFYIVIANIIVITIAGLLFFIIRRKKASN